MGGEDYEQVVLRHKDRVHSYAAWMLHDLDEAGDVAQEALVRLWMHREKVDTKTATSWLLRTTHNLCIDRMRRGKVRPQADPDVLSVMEDRSQPGPERSAHGHQVAEAIATALTVLSPRDRAAVVMREIQGMSYNEISDLLDVPLGTLKAVLHRARDRLRAELIGAGVRP
jgi:RNA polymerase sigma-70 factor (ECF subfamily)